MKKKYSRKEIAELPGIDKAAKEKEKRIREYRREASRLVSMANKRLVRLEGNKLTDSPAYKNLMVNGDGTKPRFGIRGKSYNEVQSEVARMTRFLDSQTSTVRGANQTLKDMAKNTGIKYKNMTDLKSKAKQFFELSSKVEQYLRTVDDMATAIGYQKIWEAVNKYVKEFDRDVGSSKMSIEQMTAEISNAIKEYEEKIMINDMNNSNFGWFTLDKD